MQGIIFISVKMHSPLLHSLCLSKDCVAANGVPHFSCVASAAHFLLFGGVFMAQIADIIKYEGDNSTFIWKHHLEDFNSLTQLIVHESQEAIFFMNGQALDLFGPGRYTLETENIPQIGKLLNRTTGDKTPFHCEVYFINKTEQMAIKWGTDSKVQFMEPTYGFPISIGASGEMTLKAADSRKLLIKLVGTENTFTQSTITQYFRGILNTKIKTYLAKLIILTISRTALIVTAVVGVATMLIPGCPEWIGAMLCIAVLLFYVIAIVKATAASEAVSDLGAKVKQQISAMKLMTADAEILLSKAQNDEIMFALEE